MYDLYMRIDNTGLSLDEMSSLIENETSFMYDSISKEFNSLIFCVPDEDEANNLENELTSELVKLALETGYDCDDVYFELE